MKVVKLAGIIFFILLCNQSFAQGILILEIPGTIRNYKFYEKDRIQFILQPGDQLINGRIARLHQNVLFLDGSVNEITLDSITAFYTARKGFRFIGELFLKAGLGYFIVGSVNQWIDGDDEGLIRNPWPIGGGLAVTGGILLYFRQKKHVIDNQKWRLVMIPDPD
ncbi:MAG: hypothetical protein ACNA7V_06965 [Bacteroidales bacterium]